MNFIDYIWGCVVYNFRCDMPQTLASNVSSWFIDLNFIFGSCVMFMNSRMIFEVIRNKISWQEIMSINKVKFEDI